MPNKARMLDMMLLTTPCSLEMHLMLMDVTTTSTRLWPYYWTSMVMLTPPCCLEMMLVDVTTTTTRLWPYYPTCMMMLTPPCCLEMHLLMDVTTTPTRLCMKKMARRP